jgi:hypothetical protein
MRKGGYAQVRATHRICAIGILEPWIAPRKLSGEQNLALAAHMHCPTGDHAGPAPSLAAGRAWYRAEHRRYLERSQAPGGLSSKKALRAADQDQSDVVAPGASCRERHGINLKPVAKWRSRSSTVDLR